MRDIKDYTDKYVDEPFESTMVDIRKKLVINQCLKYRHQLGFYVKDQGSYLKPFTHLQMQECLNKGIINDLVIEGLAKIIEYIPEYGAGIYVNVRKI